MAMWTSPLLAQTSPESDKARASGGGLDKSLQLRRKIDWRLQHRIVSGIADLLDFRMRIEPRIDTAHEILADAVVEFTEQYQHRRFNLVSACREVVSDEGAHIVLEGLRARRVARPMQHHVQPCLGNPVADGIADQSQRGFVLFESRGKESECRVVERQ